MRCARLLLLLALLAPSLRVWAQPSTEPDPAVAAQEALRTFDGAERARVAAEPSDGLGQADPWLVVDELLARARRDVAEWVAGRIARTAEREALQAHLARGAARSDSQAAREALRAALASDEPQRVRDGLLPHLAAGAVAQEAATILEARIARRLAWAHEALGDEASSLEALTATAAAAQRIGWARMELVAAVELARWHGGQERPSDAVRVLRHVRPLWREYGDLPEAVESMGELVVRFDELGSTDDALAVLGELAQRSAALRAPEDAALAVSNLGLAEMERGRLLSALARHRQAQGMIAGRHAPALALELRVRIAGVQELAGLLDEAIAELTAVRPLWSALEPPDREGEAITLGNLSRALALAGKPSEARLALEAAEVLYRDVAPKPNLWDVAINRGWYDSLAEVRDESVRALEALRLVVDPEMTARRRVQVLESLARCRMRRGEASAAVELLEAAAALLPDLPTGDSMLTEIPGELGVAYAAAGATKRALEQFDRFVLAAVAEVDGLECGCATTFRGIVTREVISAAIASALRARDVPTLWRYLEASRGLRLLAALGGRSTLGRVLLKEDLKQELVTAQEAELVAWRDLALVRDTKRLKAGDPGWKGPKEAVEQAQQRREAVAARVAQASRFEGEDDLGPAVKLKSADQVRAVLEERDAVLSLFLQGTGGGVVACLLTRAGQSAHLLPVGDLLTRTSRDIRREAVAASDPTRSTKEREASRAALAALLAEAGAALREHLPLPPTVTRLAIVPEAALCFLPYAALFPQHEVSILPSGTLFVRLLGDDRRTGVHSLALGDPDYTGRSLVAGIAAAASLAPALTRSSLARLRPLPHTRPEALAVAAQGGKALLDVDATATRLIEELAAHPDRRWRSIHFACHAKVNADHPSLSGLALTGGLMTAHEVFALDLNTDLVVLSACDTATDPYVMGEGISGLVRAFLHAGAPRVLASLWEVPDDCTAVLMAEFYRRLGEPGRSVAEALRLAQEHVKQAEGGRWASPEHWAAWTLWGAR